MRLLRWVCFFVLTAGLGLALGLANAEDVVRPSPPVFAGGRLVGQVVTASGRPLAGAHVSVAPIGLESPPVVPVPEPMSPGVRQAPRQPVRDGAVVDSQAGGQGQTRGSGGSGQGGVSRGGTASDAPGGGRIGSPFPTFEVWTDRRGSFHMELPFGRYIVKVSAPGFQTVLYENALSITLSNTHRSH